MARMILSGGACPVCDRDVPRTLTQVAGIQKEIFHCPDHGRLEYSPHHVPLSDLGRGAAALPDRPQAVTGLELVY